jgi:hypothetical protein
VRAYNRSVGRTVPNYHAHIFSRVISAVCPEEVEGATNWSFGRTVPNHHAHLQSRIISAMCPEDAEREKRRDFVAEILGR